MSEFSFEPGMEPETIYMDTKGTVLFYICNHSKLTLTKVNELSQLVCKLCEFPLNSPPDPSSPHPHCPHQFVYLYPDRWLCKDCQTNWPKLTNIVATAKTNDKPTPLYPNSDWSTLLPPLHQKTCPARD